MLGGVDGRLYTYGVISDGGFVTFYARRLARYGATSATRAIGDGFCR